MKGFAIHNAPTNHGGRIPSTQVRSSQEGNLFVRAGDGHFVLNVKFGQPYNQAITMSFLMVSLWLM